MVRNEVARAQEVLEVLGRLLNSSFTTIQSEILLLFLLLVVVVLVGVVLVVVSVVVVLVVVVLVVVVLTGTKGGAVGERLEAKDEVAVAREVLEGLDWLVNSLVLFLVEVVCLFVLDCCLRFRRCVGLSWCWWQFCSPS